MPSSKIAEEGNNNASSGKRDVSVLFTTEALLLLIGILRNSMLAYMLGLEGRGSYAVCVMFAEILGTVFTVSVDRGAQYWVAAKRMDISRGFASALIASFWGCSLAMALAFPFILGDSAFFQQAETGSFYLCLLLVPLISFSRAASLQLAGLRCFVPLLVFSVASSLVAALTLPVLVLQLGLGVDGAILALIVSHIVLFGSCLGYLIKCRALVFRVPSWMDFRHVLGYGLRYHFIKLDGIIRRHFGVLVLSLIAVSRADIGLFAAAYALVSQAKRLPESVQAALFPRLASGDMTRAPEMTGVSLRLTCLLVGSAFALLLAISEPLVRILLSESFLPAVSLIWILAPGVYAEAASLIFATYFNGANRPEIPSYSVWVGFAGSMVFLLALPAPLDIRTVSWTVTICMLLRAAFLCFMFQQATGMSFLSIWLPRRSDFDYLFRGIQRWLPMLGRR